jgi:transcriptional regulator with XRE-family HTH domain
MDAASSETPVQWPAMGESKRSVTPAGAGDGGNDPPVFAGARIRALRREKGWTLVELAAASGVSRSMLSQIELDQVNPTLLVAHRMARAFGMSLGELVDPPQRVPAIEVARSRAGTFSVRSGKGARLRALAPPRLESQIGFYDLRLRPGAILKGGPQPAGTRNVVAVHQGVVKVVAGPNECELGAGDSAHCPADVPYTFENTGRGEAIAYIVELPGTT